MNSDELLEYLIATDQINDIFEPTKKNEKINNDVHKHTEQTKKINQNDKSEDIKNGKR